MSGVRGGSCGGLHELVPRVALELRRRTFAGRSRDCAV
jgi:hypothetical protein